MGRILLIDDELSSRLVMHNRLKDLGHDVTVAENGAKGLLEVREAPFDLVLVEYNLASGVSGPEVCRRLKQMPQVMTVPVVMISRHAGSREDVHKGFESGCDAFVTKADLAVLDDVLSSMLHFKSLHDEAARQIQLGGLIPQGGSAGDLPLRGGGVLRARDLLGVGEGKEPGGVRITRIQLGGAGERRPRLPVAMEAEVGAS